MRDNMNANKNPPGTNQTLYIKSTTTIPTIPSMPPAAKALLAALGFAVRGVGVAVLGALVAAVALAVVVVLRDIGTVIGPVGSRMVVLRATLELATVTLGVALVEWVELLLAVRRALDEEEYVLDVYAVEVALADSVEIEMDEGGRLIAADEVGTWTCPSEICVTGAPLVADTDTDPDWELEAALEVMLVAEVAEGPAAFEIPNWVEYWYCPVPVAMIWIP